ncbi:unnamed protein product, partial [Amoebophrya sp. A120]|eukprot:GSA120T00023960001.1
MSNSISTTGLAAIAIVTSSPLGNGGPSTVAAVQTVADASKRPSFRVDRYRKTQLAAVAAERRINKGGNDEVDETSRRRATTTSQKSSYGLVMSSRSSRAGKERKDSFVSKIQVEKQKHLIVQRTETRDDHNAGYADHEHDENQNAEGASEEEQAPPCAFPTQADEIWRTDDLYDDSYSIIPRVDLSTSAALAAREFYLTAVEKLLQNDTTIDLNLTQYILTTPPVAVIYDGAEEAAGAGSNLFPAYYQNAEGHLTPMQDLEDVADDLTVKWYDLPKDEDLNYAYYQQQKEKMQGAYTADYVKHKCQALTAQLGYHYFNLIRQRNKWSCYPIPPRMVHDSATGELKEVTHDLPRANVYSMVANSTCATSYASQSTFVFPIVPQADASPSADGLYEFDNIEKMLLPDVVTGIQEPPSPQVNQFINANGGRFFYSYPAALHWCASVCDKFAANCDGFEVVGYRDANGVGVNGTEVDGASYLPGLSFCRLLYAEAAVAQLTPEEELMINTGIKNVTAETVAGTSKGEELAPPAGTLAAYVGYQGEPRDLLRMHPEMEGITDDGSSTFECPAGGLEWQQRYYETHAMSEHHLLNNQVQLQQSSVPIDSGTNAHGVEMTLQTSPTAASAASFIEINMEQRLHED